jgi:glycosyltransferase involved in cell wall biosynthesis
MVSVSSNSVAPATRGAGRVTVLCQDVPYPAHHGGKLDLWNIIRGLHQQGATIQLVCWFARERLAPAVKRELERVAADVVEVQRRDGLWRLLHARYPPRMLAFEPSSVDGDELRRRVGAFDPDWILFDHWAAYLPARTLSKGLGRPLVYRSQNVEHRYYRELGRVARGALKLKLALNSRRLLAVEREIRSSVDLIADISAEDRDEWVALGGAGRSVVVPPVWIDPVRGERDNCSRDIDVLFVGNLRTPNNVEGLGWFISGVLPILRRRMAPHVPRVVFAGSEPDAGDVAGWRHEGIECELNPADVLPFYARARVVINPLQRGSGVNLKMIEAFTTGAAVVATPAAVRGLPGDVRSHYAVCATPEAFASAVLEALSSSSGNADPRARAALVERYFGAANLQALLAALDPRRTRTASAPLA